MEIRTLLSFITAAETGSLTKASTICHLTNSAVCKHIKDLESELGVTLLIRRKNDVRLTEFGEMFITRARNIINEVHGAKREITNAKGELTGELRIGAGSFIEPFMGLPIASFMIRYPKVKLHINYNYAGELNQKLKSGDLDLAFTMNLPQHNEDIVSKPCFRFNLCAIMHREHPLASKDNLTIQDLLPYRILVPDNGKREMATFQHVSGVDVSKLLSLSSCECNNANALLNGLEILQAITFLPEEYVLNRTNLVAKRVAEFGKVFTSNAHWIKDVPMKECARVFLNIIDEYNK